MWPENILGRRANAPLSRGPTQLCRLGGGDKTFFEKLPKTCCFSSSSPSFPLQTDHPRELQHGPIRLPDGPPELPPHHRQL